MSPEVVTSALKFVVPYQIKYSISKKSMVLEVRIVTSFGEKEWVVTDNSYEDFHMLVIFYFLIWMD